MGAGEHAVGTTRDAAGEGGVLPEGINAVLPFFMADRLGCFEEAAPDLVVTPEGQASSTTGGAIIIVIREVAKELPLHRGRGFLSVSIPVELG